LVLASASPRRREILAAMGAAFLVRAADVDENVLPGETADAYLERVVLAKLQAARAAHVAGAPPYLLVADTTVSLDGELLGKPASTEEATAFLLRLGGRSHAVRTRFLLGHVDEDRPRHGQTVETRMTFRPLTAAQARAYAATGEGLDKAGGYAVQGGAAKFVSRIDGSYTNVVGLPACELAVVLEALGLLP
jgi:septum formation protein